MSFKREEPLVKLDYNQPKIEQEEPEPLFNNTPTYMRKQMESVEDNLETPEPVVTADQQDDVLVFSDDLEVPAFIRNRNLSES